ncbi:LETM1 domain-containing protein 1-like [Mizuhopecten yessoensis]|uniref:LETM1 domain-containing protein 1 n=1 Tax=Mizuhopecten yessoensis TaxID=6573 RepID=A0A210Q033_MIZYE|nr:LETM1 domain-containing protein 1-like [Mizuhopecten yessoensis]OWF42086.1 LETM1 domain-containing protein 1 [Mizuhopecten yessoensis]
MLSRRILLLNHVAYRNTIIRCCSEKASLNKFPHVAPVPNPEEIPHDHDRPVPVKRKIRTKVTTPLFAILLNRFEKLLEQTVPRKVFQKYSWARDGMIELKDDTKIYFDVSKRISKGDEFSTFTRKELSVFNQLPREMKKAAPLIVLCAAPMGFFFLPMMFMFPKYTLSSHFLTDQQLREVNTRKLYWRLHCFPNVMDCLKIQIRLISDQQEAYNALKSIIIKTEEGCEIYAFEIVPTARGFSIDHSENSFWNTRSKLYSWQLANSFGMGRNRMKVYNQIMAVHYTDMCIVKEGLDALTDRELQTACYVRGLNADGLTREEQEDFMKEWLEVSLHTNSANINMLLHTMVFLNYDAPTNVKIMPRWFWKKRLRISEH